MSYDTCAICHKQGKGCCFIKTANNSLHIGIFLDDIKKIESHLNVDRDYFIEVDSIDSILREFLSNTIHPVFDKIFYQNTRHKLKTIDDKCIFLTDTGCKLPTEIRPLYCRIYPFWLSYDNKHINVLSSDECLAQEQSTLSWHIVNQHFGCTEEYLRDLFAQVLLYAEQHVKGLQGE